MKYILILILFVINLYSLEILISKKDIAYHELLQYENLFVLKSDKKVRCVMFNKKNLLKRNYQTKRYILKNHPICKKDVKIFVKSKIRYDFGNIIIEKDAKVIGETKQYIKIKNSNGTIDKIYKNGQVK